MTEVVIRSLAFLEGGGEMGARVRAHDWAATPLGPPEGWPEPLRTMVSVVLNSALLGTVLWGPDLRLIYNDAYAPALAERHPDALGRPIAEVWDTVWEQLAPNFLRVMATGEPHFETRYALPMRRHGQSEMTYWNYSIAPICDGTGRIVGLLNQALETTGEIIAERRQRAVFDSAVDIAIIATDRNGLVTDWNTGAERVFGWTAEEMRGQPADRFFTPEDRASGQVETEMRVALSDGRAADERWHLRKDGGRFWASGELMPLRDEEGAHLGFTKIARDRTAEHIAGKALKDAEARLRRAQAAGGIGLFTVDIPGSTLYPTAEFCRLYGLPERDSYPAAAFEALVIPEDAHLISSAATRARGDAFPDVEYRIRRPDTGKVRWIARKGEIERDAGGRPVQFSGVSHDVTERRVAEDRLRASEALARDNAQRVQAMVDQSSAGIAQTTLDGRFIFVNDRYCSIVGRSREELLSLRMHDLTDPDHLPGNAKQFQALAQGGSSFDIEKRYLRPDGTTIWVRNSVTSVRGMDGQIASMFAVSLDISEQRLAATRQQEAEIALRGANDTLEQRVATALDEREKIADALRQAQKMEAIGQLTGGVAHDFNNLLTVIKSSTDLLKRPNLPEERRTRYVAAISSTVDRAAKLTNQLLAFARRQSLKPETFDACVGVRALCEMMGTLVGSRINVDTILPAKGCHVLADPSQFDTALVNLAVNARDAMDGAGRLAVAVRTSNRIPAMRSHSSRSGAFVAVSVTDTGSGIPAEQLETIFEPFFTTKAVGQGTGLGLSQVIGFAKQSGGDITVESEVGRGTTFTLYLPRVDAPAITSEAAEPEPLVDGHGTGVLVVEDNAEVGTFAVQTLSDLGYVPVLARDAGEALAELARDADRFDVVFSDVVMPGMDGIELGQEIRRMYHDLPVVLASGYSHVLAQNGTYGFELLHKPYSVEQLSRILRKTATWKRRKRILGA